MQDPASELPRIPLLRTPVNKKEKVPQLLGWNRPASVVYAPLHTGPGKVPTALPSSHRISPGGPLYVLRKPCSAYFDVTRNTNPPPHE